MFREPLERWEIWVYPLVSFTTIAWLSWPLTLYWHQVLRWETLLWIGLGIGEIYHFRHKRPGLSRAALVALPLSLSFGLFNPGDPRLIFWIALGLFGYLWLLDSLPSALGSIHQRLRRRNK